MLTRMTSGQGRNLCKMIAVEFDNAGEPLKNKRPKINDVVTQRHDATLLRLR